MYATLDQLPQAQKHITDSGLIVIKDDSTFKDGRPSYFVFSERSQWHLSDQELLLFASTNAWMD